MKQGSKYIEIIPSKVDSPTLLRGKSGEGAPTKRL